MYEHSDIIVVGAGGRGGAGTFQEFLGGLLLWHNKSPVFQPNSKHIHTIQTCPMIVDNRLGMFSSMVELGKRLGYQEHFRVVEGTSAVTQKITEILRQERTPGFGGNGIGRNSRGSGGGQLYR